MLLEEERIFHSLVRSIGKKYCEDRCIAIAFYIVPLVNAMIRVGTMAEKERLFLAFVEGDTMVPCGKRGAKGTMERVDIESRVNAPMLKSSKIK